MRAALLVTTALAAACGGAKAPPPESTSTPPAGAVTPAAPDSAAVVPGAEVKADTAKKPGTPAKAEGPLRDSAFGPKFAVDSTGKVVPIKKP